MNNLTNINYLKNLFKQHGLRPKEYLGQNFLVDEEVLSELIAAAELKQSDTVLEVGSGIGTLTVELVKRAGKVIAVEKDIKLFNILKKLFYYGLTDSGLIIRNPQSANPQLQLINQNILKFNINENIKDPYKVVANIPYYLTSHLIQYFLNQKNKPRLLVLMVQKEVAERITAGPGKLSILGISVQVFADAEIEALVPKASFWPTPEVDSAILKITPRNKYGSEITDYRLFFRIVKTAFAGKRKQIKNTIRNPEALKQAGIDPTSRPQDLSIEDWIRLYKLVNSSKNAGQPAFFVL